MILKLLLILILLLLIAFLVVLTISYYFVRFITHPKCISNEVNIAKEKSFGHWGNFDSIPKETLLIPMSDQYMIHGIHLIHDQKRFVIISHGYTGNKYSSVKYAQIFIKLGYDVILYDLRYHGDNVKTLSSMSFKESDDILQIADYIRQHYGSDIPIGLHGESMGSASSLTAVARNDCFSFLISDCGFSDFEELMRYLAKEKFHLPVFFAYTSSLLNRILHGFSFIEIKPIKELAENHTCQTPILFIHGKEDRFIPPSMCESLYHMYEGKKRIYLMAGAEHAQSYSVNPSLYTQLIIDFLNSCGL